MIMAAQQKLIDTNKRLKIDKCSAIVMSCLCKTDEQALAMEEFVRKHPNEEFDVYHEKACEIIGEPCPEYVVSDDD